MKNLMLLLVFAVMIFVLLGCEVTVDRSVQFEIAIDESLHTDALDGRLLLLISNNDENA